MTATTITRTSSNGQPRKTLSSQLDRLDGILDGLDAALAGAVQEAVEQAVKQAVHAVLTEVLTNRQLQEQIQQAVQLAPQPEETQRKQSMLTSLWQATIQGVRRTLQKVKQLGRGVGMAVVAIGGAMAAVAYAARKKIASTASTLYRAGRRIFGKGSTALASILPPFAFGGTGLG